MVEKSPDAFRTISEVAEDLELPQHVLRFWETRFSQIKPLKRGGGLQRLEVEIQLTRAQFEALWPLTEGRRVEKTRYDIAFQGHVIELDVYDGALTGLLTAEVEFASLEASTAFQPPSWLDREITEDKRYKNKNLAVHGKP